MMKILEKFLLSENELTGPSGSVEDIINHLSYVRNKTQVSISTIPISSMHDWSYHNGALEHSSGKFFKIRGLRQKLNNIVWDQPIIDQREIGFLGLICNEINGVMCFLLQIKIEPGNINHVQLSPTLQATKSNFTTVHQGKVPTYFENFYNVDDSKIIFDQIQSEQGARFFKKRNRNIIIYDNVSAVNENFLWVTLGQVRILMLHDNTINMDTRTVLSNIDYSSLYFDNVKHFDIHHNIIKNDFFQSELSNKSLESMKVINSWYVNKKFNDTSVNSFISLYDLEDWEVSSLSISRPDNKYFTVEALNILISGREVSSWNQPIIKPSSKGICCFFIKKIDDVYHFLVQMKFECGNLDFYEIGPTIQGQNNLLNNLDIDFKNVIEKVNIACTSIKVIHDSNQSEEGGRFYHEQNRNLIIDIMDNNISFDNNNYKWLTLNQIKKLIRINNFVNIQARNLISLINYF